MAKYEIRLTEIWFDVEIPDDVAATGDVDLALEAAISAELASRVPAYDAFPLES